MKDNPVVYVVFDHGMDIIDAVFIQYSEALEFVNKKLDTGEYNTWYKPETYIQEHQTK